MDIEVINLERKKQKLSVAELASRANLPKSTVEKILFGIVKNPRKDTIEAIEKALGIENDLWTAEDYENGITDKKRVWITADEETWLNYYKELQSISDQDYNTVCLFIETLIKSKK